MKKRGKKVKTVDYENIKQSKIALLTKLVDKLDDNSLKLSSCEIRMYILDAIEL